jgi:hypothetical protein
MPSNTSKATFDLSEFFAPQPKLGSVMKASEGHPFSPELVANVRAL